MTKNVNGKGNDTTTYRNASSLLHLSPQDKAKVNAGQNSQEGGKNYKQQEQEKWEG
ncbi:MULTISPECIES: hypothetical protein [unclassified Psychrobacillus]|jgi:hypothetical protein|uniref:hypothetical protein n=1 Tax=unclassified Psychrobacillus TaxID=2636677 RepID=UPI00146B56E0|nr:MULTISPECIES: hypothetical protein [unclassified Psychrobacillus]MCM3360257.1 hypothetical protein [Psychrobacillus sp. MER TA 171]NME06257.1 hypothetical protein [Psychrobacillus sp. BL-248-WT-3]